VSPQACCRTAAAVSSQHDHVKRDTSSDASYVVHCSLFCRLPCMINLG
jgi:hypothetical protein